MYHAAIDLTLRPDKVSSFFIVHHDLSTKFIIILQISATANITEKGRKFTKKDVDENPLFVFKNSLWVCLCIRKV